MSKTIVIRRLENHRIYISALYLFLARRKVPKRRIKKKTSQNTVQNGGNQEEDAAHEE